MIVSFSQLCGMYFSISEIYAQEQFGHNAQVFRMKSPRKTDALILFTEAEGRYERENKPPLFISKGDMVYIPAGSLYTCTSHCVDGAELSSALLIEFSLRQINIVKGTKSELSVGTTEMEEIHFGDDLFCVMENCTERYEHLFSDLIEVYSKQLFPLPVYCAIYRIFNAISQDFYLKKPKAPDLSIISKGIQYLKEDFAQEKSIGEIARMCSVSIGYFSRLFRQYAGVTPSEYRIMRKIERAKQLLHRHELSLEEIAESLNFCDEAYLCRIFKKKTEMTPNEFRKLFSENADLTSHTRNR